MVDVFLELIKKRTKAAPNRTRESMAKKPWMSANMLQKPRFRSPAKSSAMTL